ncbi:hypothetical protein [Sorangium sp. So ce1335]
MAASSPRSPGSSAALLAARLAARLAALLAARLAGCRRISPTTAPWA